MSAIDEQLFGSFDGEHPPSKALIDDCVHCGFCLPACPTFVLWGEEMDSPRGRIYLMRAALDGGEITGEMVKHFDSCLGCMSCVTSCPSGVQYDKLIEATRGQVERLYRRPLADRLKRAMVFSIFPFPHRLRIVRTLLKIYQSSGLQTFIRAARVLRLFPPSLRAMESIAPKIARSESLPEFSSAIGTSRGTVGLLLGCVQGAFFPEVNEATVRVLTAEGYNVVAPAHQGCCGALSGHSGRLHEAQGFARRLIDCFESAGVDTIITNSAGCGSSMKEYGQLLSGDRIYQERAQQFADHTVDIAEFLANTTPLSTRHPLAITIAYHDACHLGHAQRIREQPRSLLLQIPQLSIVEITESEICCGSAGVYNIFQSEAASALGERKAGFVSLTNADLLIAANPGCSLQISAALQQRGNNMPAAHTIELLDASIQGETAIAFLERLREP